MCHPKDDYAGDEMMQAGREAWDAVMRFEDARRRIKQMERELDRARVEMDINFDPQCDIKEARDNMGGCRRCRGNEVQGD